MRGSGAAALGAALALALTACSGDDAPEARPSASGSLVLDDPCDDDARPTERSAAEVPVLDDDGPGSLGLHVSSLYPRTVSLEVTFDGRTALDAELPGVDPACHAEPIYRYAFERPRGAVTVAATVEGRTRTVTIPADAGRRWIVVVLQPGFPVRPTLFRTEPQWG